MEKLLPGSRPIRPVRERLLIGDLDRLDGISLAGSHCATCAETTLGLTSICANCGGHDLSATRLADKGFLWSFTVARHMPPGAYRGPRPFEPFGLGLVELPDGIRVLAPLQVEVEDLKIGMPLRFNPYVRTDADHDTVVFSYRAEPLDDPAHV